MTKSDNTHETARTETASKPFLAQVLLYFGVGGTPGALAALVAIGFERGFDWVILGLLLFFAVGGFLLIRYALRIGNFDPPGFSTKTGLNQTILLGSALVGVVIAAYLNLSGRSRELVEGTFVLSPTEAMVGLGILMAFIPVAFFWHRVADEHEMAAINFASIIAIYVYLYGYIGWTLASYAGLMPPMNDFVFFIVVLMTLSIVWAFKRAG